MPSRWTSRIMPLIQIISAACSLSGRVHTQQLKLGLQCSNVKITMNYDTENHSNFDTSIYQTLIKSWGILWVTLKMLKSTHFQYDFSKSYWTYKLAQYNGGWFERLITSCADFLTWSNSLDFSVYGKKSDVIFSGTISLHRSVISQLGAE